VLIITACNLGQHYGWVDLQKTPPSSIDIGETNPVITKPEITMWWNWNLSAYPAPTGDLLASGDKIIWSGVPGVGWSQYKDKMVKAELVAGSEPLGGYNYLQWSLVFNPPTASQKIKFVSGQLVPNGSTATLEHNTNLGVQTVQVWVWNCDVNGVRPIDPNIKAECYFVLEATL
jgi:hypothetical protein